MKKQFYRDPATSIRGAQGQTIGSARVMKGKFGPPAKMKRAAKQVGSLNPSRWASGGRNS